MKLYHGTSATHWERIQSEGIRPRGDTGRTNFKHTIESNSDTVYLTDAYALFFALQATDTDKLKTGRAIIIEVDTDKLDPSKLVPDEDALEQVGRFNDNLPDSWNMLRRTRHYRKKTTEASAAGLDFYWSLRALGTGGHKGIILPSAFTRIATIDIAKQLKLCFTFIDAQVSVLNYQYVGGKYKALTKQIFGDSLTFEEIQHLQLHGFYSFDRTGIEIKGVNHVQK